MTQSSNSILELKNVSKVFGSRHTKSIHALQNVNININQSEVYCLTGPSGSGKTTLLQIAGTLDSPSSGEIYISGKKISSQKESARTMARQQHIGFIYQYHHLIPEFSALENVALSLLIKGIDKNTAYKQSKSILEMVDMGSRINHKPSELSGGQQQRAAICRAIVGKPSLILADEPTGNLDSKNSNIVFELLLDLAKNNNLSCLIVTHNNELAKKIEHQLVINDGIVSKI